jgi:hypothetical protein
VRNNTELGELSGWLCGSLLPTIRDFSRTARVLYCLVSRVS